MPNPRALRVTAPWCAVAVLVIATGLFGARASAEESAGVRTASVPEAWELMSHGRVDEAIDRLRRIAAERDGDPQWATLRDHLDLREVNEQARRERQREGFASAVEQLEQYATDGQLLEALSTAAEALDLAEDRRAFLNDEPIVELVERAEAEAAQREADGDWLEALSLYRGLNTLYDDNGDTYREPVRRVARRVRLLRLYAPDVLHELYVEHAERHDEEPPARFDNDDEQEWQQQLDDIDLSMLRVSMALAAQNHIDSASFKPLLIGAADAVQVMLHTPGLTGTFPMLEDAEQVEAFSEYLGDLKARLEGRETPVSQPEALGIVSRLMEFNRRTVNLPERVVIHELGDGAMASLDEFSAIIWPSQRQMFERTTEGRFSGVGIQITLRDGQLTVVSPLEDTPAHQAGIKADDRIMTINGRATTGITLEQAVNRITGEEGTKVTLGIQRPGTDRTQEVELVRSSIRIVSLKGWRREAGGGWDYYVDPALRIGYLRLSQFGPETADELDRAVEEMRNGEGLNALILDLRFNPGGLLSAAVAVANRFLDTGEIVSIEGAMSDRPNRFRADRQHTYPNIPVVVMINKGSASASEIVAGSLQAHNRAVVVGERSYGKGSVQNLFPISAQRAFLKLTTQYYKMPDGRVIHRRPNADQWGIDPDLPVRMTDRQIAELLRARMALDVLRDADDAPAPLLDDEEAQADTPRVESADDILERGLDPQLETVLLLLKSRLLSEPTG